MKARARWALALAVLAALGALGFGTPDAEMAAPRHAPAAAQAPFVPSMAGTRPDGPVRAAPAGALTIDAELRHLFDYYLSALGEADLPAIRAGIEQELAHRLQPAAAAEAKRLLGQYLAYKAALADTEAAAASPAGSSLAAAARARLGVMQGQRQRFFTSAEAAGLFGDSDARDLDAIARLELMDNKALAPQQREERLAELDRRLPPELQAERAEPLRIVTLEERVAAARAGGAGEDDIFRLRASALDPQAANRLAQLDREQADWLRRIAAYRSEASRLGGNPAALQQLRDSFFTPFEQKRLGAYE